MARDRADTSEKTVKLVDGLRDAILAKQNKDGSWNPGGQLPSQKRPVPETKQVSTMWTILALATIDDSSEARREKPGKCPEMAASEHTWREEAAAQQRVVHGTAAC